MHPRKMYHARDRIKGRAQRTKRAHEGRTEECVKKERQVYMRARGKQLESDRYRI